MMSSDILTDSMEIQSAGGTNTWYDIGTTSHTVYVTYATPQPGGSATTVKRMDWACDKADGASSETAIADAIHNALGDHDPPLDTYGDGRTEEKTGWPLLAGLPDFGYCEEQAELMSQAVNVLGVSAEKYLTMASRDASNVRDLEYQTVDGHKYYLAFDFDNNGLVDNRFEGTVSAGGRYYAVLPKLVADSECGLLRQVGPDNRQASQKWVEYFNDNCWTTWPIGYPPGVVSYPSCP